MEVERSGRSPALAAFALVLALALAAPAAADFPYTGKSGKPRKPGTWRLGPGETPSDLRIGDKLEWMYSATPEPGNSAVNADPMELDGVRGAHLVDDDPAAETAFRRTTGRPEVTIAVLDSGFKWNEENGNLNLRKKTRLNRGELPRPRRDALKKPNEPRQDCSRSGPFRGRGVDLNRDGVFNVIDYACDRRVDPAPRLGVGPKTGADRLDPQDILIAFSDGVDDDRNGFVDDIVGWDFLDDDNDPFDDVQYGHGTGEAKDSVAEANQEGDSQLATCPNCMAIHMRVGDSFVAETNRFAAAVIYAVDNGALVIQEALGTINNTNLAREAVRYAYRHGVTVIASAADEAAQHNNWPSSLPHVILVNSVTRYGSFADPTDFGLPPETPNPLEEKPRSYLKFNGCTNFNAKVTLAIPSVSCSSDATGRAAGMAGLIHSAAIGAVEAGKLRPHPRCRLAQGGRCAITPNEVRQIMASGSFDGQAAADDVDFTAIEGSCSPVPLPGCTNPAMNSLPVQPAVTVTPSIRYPARAGHDQFYGWGRVNMSRATGALLPGSGRSLIPPEVEITSPDWYSQIKPQRQSFELRGEVYARGRAYVCSVHVAPGHYPNNSLNTDSPPGDFAKVPSSHCDGQTERSGRFAGRLAGIDIGALRARFPADAGSFDGRESGLSGIQAFNGRPNTSPYGFTVRVVARTIGGPAMTGEDRRAMFLHRDQDMLAGFPHKLASDGASSPALADLDGDNRNELIAATSDGFVHAWSYNAVTGRKRELRGWPVRTRRPPIVARHLDARAYAGDHVGTDLGGPVLSGVSVADADRDGVPEVYAADMEGRIYGWAANGSRVFAARANPRYSGRPLRPFRNVREGPRNRTQQGIVSAPVLADLDRNDGGRLELIVAGMDRHVYAFNDDGKPVKGFPVLVVDTTKVQRVDPKTHAVRFAESAGPDLDQGAIVDTPAVGDITGDRRPEILIGTNEEYAVDEGSEGPHNVAPDSAIPSELLSASGLLDFANSRLYAIKPSGDRDGKPETPDAFVSGWPRPIALLMAEILPVVGEGINGSPVIAPLDCPAGGSGPKVGVMPAAGYAYLLNADGTSCYGQSGGRDRVLASVISLAAGKTDTPVFAAVGLPAFADLGLGAPAFLGPVAGLIRALDLAINEYQLGGQDFIGAWDTRTGQFSPGWPARVNDLQFLTGPVAADITGDGTDEVIGGTASMDLAAFGPAGVPPSDRWPKLTTDWTVATPLTGSLGTIDTDAGARRVVVNLTRSGYINAYRTPADPCDPASWPRFHHDNASSGDYRRDALAPGKPAGLAIEGRELTFTAPGDDLLCGRVARFQVMSSDQPIRPSNFRKGRAVKASTPVVDPGERTGVGLPDLLGRYVAVRAVDEQGNVGRTAEIDTVRDDVSSR